MSPSIPRPQPAFEIPKSGCPFAQNLESSESLSFSPGSTDGSRLKTGPVKANLSSRSKPRLTKVRRKQVAAHQTERSVNTDLGLNGASDVGGEARLEFKFGAAAGVKNGNTGSNGCVESRGFTGSAGGLSVSGDGFGLNDSLFGFRLGIGNEKSLFGSIKGTSASNLQSKESSFLFASDKFGSNADVQKGTGEPVFGAHKDDSTFDRDSERRGNLFVSSDNELLKDSNSERPQFVFGVHKRESVWNTQFSATEFSESLRRPKVAETDGSGSIKFSYASSANLGQQSSNADLGKNGSESFIFDSSKESNTIPEKQDCFKNMAKADPVEDAGNAGDSVKVSHVSFLFPSTSSDNCVKDNVKFVFGSNISESKLCRDSEQSSTSKYSHMFGFGTGGRENAKNETEFQNAGGNGVFHFGGVKGTGGFSSGFSTDVAKDTSQLNGKEFEECSHFGQDVFDSASDINSKFQNGCHLGSITEEGSAFNISTGLKKLNLDEDGNRVKNSSITSPLNSDNVYMFGIDQRHSNFMKGDPLTNNAKKMPHIDHFSHNNLESNRSLSPSFSSFGIGIQLNGGFSEVPLTNKDERDGTSFTSKLAGSDISDSGYKAFSFTPGMEGTHTKSQVSKRSNKKIGKLRRRTIVQNLFDKDCSSRGGSSQQNHESPNCGSPMDFSPYHDVKACDSPVVGTSTRLKGESAAGENNILEHIEKPHNSEGNSNLSPSNPSRDGLSSVRRQYVKKYKMKVGSSHRVQGNDSDKENDKQEEPTGPTTPEMCEHWRIRGNEAYHAGKLSKAEEFYTMGITSASHISTLGNSIKPLLLCYSNRAATRMSLGRMMEAIGDCTKAAALDPNFLKVTLRAGNCYLVLGEVEDAIQSYSKCLNSGAGLCLDRRVTIEAGEGLQKAKKVAECMHQSSALLQEGTHNAASNALDNIEEALSISRYSERLFEMKGEALFNMRMYDDVIEHCVQTLDIAKKNYDIDNLDDSNCKIYRVQLWRWHLQIKSHYHKGMLDLALELIEKQEKLYISSKSVDSTWESSIALASTINELLCLKKSGNEAFHSGRHQEAIDNYTAAISKSIESRPFMAVCFCNRAAAYQSVNQIIDAIADCSIAIALDKHYQKAISRRATLYEIIRDYKQATSDLQSLVSILTSKVQIKNQQNDSQSKSSGGCVRDLRKAHRRLSSIEEKAKKEISLDHYLILGIKASDTESDIKKAYRKAALKHHPDKAGQALARSDVGDAGTLWREVGEKIYEDADKLFKVIGAAYAVLSDPSERSSYDAEEQLRNVYRDSSSARSSNSGQPSTSYERGSWSGRYSGFDASSERNNSSSRRYRYDSRSYGYSYSQW